MPTHRDTRGRGLLLAVGLVDLVLLTATGVLDRWLAQGTGFDDLPWSKWPLVLLSLGREQTLGAWSTSAVLALAGLLFLAAAFRGGWLSLRELVALALGLGLLALSADELSGFHERVFTSNAETAASAFAGPGPWMAPLVPLAVLGLLTFRRLRGGDLHWSQVALWAGLACLSSVALQEAIETRFSEPGQRATWLLLVEEGTELLGSWLVLAASLSARAAIGLGRQGGQDPDARGTGRPLVTPVLITVLAIASVLAAAASEQRYGEFIADPQRGLMQWWLGSAVAVAVAVAALRTGRRSPVAPAPVGRGGLRLLAGSTSVLAVAYGIDAFTWLGVAGPEYDQAARTVLGGLLAAAGLLVIGASRLASLLCVIAAGLLIFGDGAASPWEIGAWWLVVAALHDASSRRGTQPGSSARSDVPAHDDPVPVAQGLGWPDAPAAPMASGPAPQPVC